MVATTLDVYGGLDLALNNAGIPNTRERWPMSETMTGTTRSR
jgi:hypothetical protein